MMESDPAFHMSQDKIPVLVFGTAVTEILSHELWLSIWPLTLKSKGLIRYGDGVKMTNRSVAG
jgi:hypothetical protein